MLVESAEDRRSKVVTAGSFVIFLAVISLSALFPGPSAHGLASAQNTGVIVPLYIYPGSSWTALVQARSSYPSVPIIAVINPNSGPGTSQDPNYVSGIQQLQAAGVTVLGYVHTSYGARPITTDEAEVQSYNSWYHVNGIFFDEMSNDLSNQAYYSALNTFVKGLGMSFTVGNPGIAVPAAYIGVFDSIVVYESSGLPVASLAGSNYPGYSKGDFTVISYGVADPGQAYMTSISADTGYVYLTDAAGANPYGVLVSYFADEVSMLDGPTSSSVTSSTSTSTTTPSTTTATSTITTTITTVQTQTVTRTLTQTTTTTAIAPTVTMTHTSTTTAPPTTVTSTVTATSTTTEVPPAQTTTVTATQAAPTSTDQTNATTTETKTETSTEFSTTVIFSTSTTTVTLDPSANATTSSSRTPLQWNQTVSPSSLSPGLTDNLAHFTSALRSFIMAEARLWSSLATSAFSYVTDRL